MVPKISERTLRKWRKEALEDIENVGNTEFKLERGERYGDLCERILRMTQELLDQHLIKSRK